MVHMLACFRHRLVTSQRIWSWGLNSEVDHPSGLAPSASPGSLRDFEYIALQASHFVDCTNLASMLLENLHFTSNPMDQESSRPGCRRRLAVRGKRFLILQRSP